LREEKAEGEKRKGKRGREKEEGKKRKDNAETQRSRRFAEDATGFDESGAIGEGWVEVLPRSLHCARDVLRSG
jgi:hypothetical protein